jgi:dTDP-4-dehydrorhamnose reductase
MRPEDPRSCLWITGAGGLIGHHLAAIASKTISGPRVVGLTRAMLELTDFAAVEARFKRDRPAQVLHCAALSKTGDCQANPGLAHKLNVEVTAFLAGLAAEIPFLFFSTDLVFDGTAGNYSETRATNPLSVYGETKVAAELVVLRNSKHTVVRTSLNAGISPTGDRGFNEILRRSWEKDETVNLFTDEYRCPLAAEVTAHAVVALISSGQTGLFHLGGNQKLSRHEIGLLLAQRWPHLNPRIRAASLADYSGAPRPADTSMDCTRLQSILPFKIPGFRRWLEENPEAPL